MLLKKGFQSIVLCLALFMCTVWSIEIVITQSLGPMMRYACPLA